MIALPLRILIVQLLMESGLEPAAPPGARKERQDERKNQIPAEGDLPWDQLGAPARRALLGAGYTLLAQLAKVPESEIKALHGIGPHALKTLRNALAQQGLSFADQ